MGERTVAGACILTIILDTHDDDGKKAVAGVGEDEEEETYSLGSVGHIFQFLQHNHIYGETVRAVDGMVPEGRWSGNR